MPEREPSQFTLRKEYFGGLVHDASTAKYELLNPEEYVFMSRLEHVDDALFDQAINNNELLRERAQKFVKVGFLDVDNNGRVSLVNVRVIPPPLVIPEGKLTAPIRVYDTYTRRCNLDCQHCYFASNSQIVEQRRTIDQTADIMRKFYEAGSMEWRFTGGEPTVRPDLFDAIGIAKGFGMSVSLNTNGWWSEGSAQKILDAGLSEIVISLEGREGINDQRRRRGAYRKSLESLGRINEYNRQNPNKKINVVINTAVGRDNVGDVEFLIRLAAKNGHNINFIPLKPSGRARDTLQSEMLSTKEFMQFSRTVQMLREDPEIETSGINIGHRYKDLFCPTYKNQSDNPFPFDYSECGALTTAVSMLPDGRVFACPFVLEIDKAGEFTGPNMNEATVEEAWFHPNIEKFRNAEKTGCLDCVYYKNQCRGACRATVLGYGGEIKDGKLVGADPYCYASLMTETE